MLENHPLPRPPLLPPPRPPPPRPPRGKQAPEEMRKQRKKSTALEEGSDPHMSSASEERNKNL